MSATDDGKGSEDVDADGFRLVTARRSKGKKKPANAAAPSTSSGRQDSGKSKRIQDLYKQGKCYVCEATGHKAMDCPDKRATSEGSAASRKRERESATPSGFTPEAKKAQSGPKEGSSKPPPVKAPKVTYAVVSGGNDLVVRNNDGSAPTAAQEKQLSVQFNKELCKLLEKGEEWCPAFNSWSRRAHGITVNVPDDRTVRWLKAKFSNFGYSVCTRKEYNDSRRTRLTGFLRGAISENLSDKAIDLITSSMLKMRKVPDGSFTVGKLEKTEAGGILPCLLYTSPSPRDS